MHLIRYNRQTLPIRAVCLTVALFVTWTTVARADRFPPDPVIEFKNALTQPLTSYLPQDPAEALKFDNLPPEEQMKRLRDSRYQDLLKRLDALRTVTDMRRALQLQGWKIRTELSEPRTADDEIRDKLIERFSGLIVDTLEKGSTDAKLATLGMLGTIVATNLSPADRARVARVFTPPVAQLIRKDKTPAIREAAAQSLSQMGCDPKLAAPALGDLLGAPSVAERRAAAEALPEIIRILITPTSKATTTFTIDPREGLEAAAAIVPVVRRGASDPDAQVRRNCLEAIYQAVLALTLQIPRPVAGVQLTFLPETREDRERDVRTIFLQLMKEIDNQSDVLARALRDSDKDVRLTALRSLEEIGSMVERLPEARPDIARLPTHPLQDTMKKVVPALGTTLTDPDSKVRLQAVDTTESFGKNAVTLAPVLVRNLEDSNSFVRWATARTLGKIAPAQAESAVPGIARLLQDNDLDLRLASATALGLYGPAAKGAIPEIVCATRGTDVVQRVAALKTLANIGTDSKVALPDIIAALKDPEARVRQTAAEVLEQFGTLAPQAEQPLRDVLQDPSADVRRAASSALLSVLGVGLNDPKYKLPAPKPQG